MYCNTNIYSMSDTGVADATIQVYDFYCVPYKQVLLVEKKFKNVTKLLANSKIAKFVSPVLHPR